MLDSLLTVCVVHQLVVFYWRGVWEIFDVHLLPNDNHKSAIICLIIAYSLQSIVCLIQPAVNCACRSNRSKLLRWAAEVVVFFFASLVGVVLWRGVWLLLNVHFLPASRAFSACLTHLMGIAVLWLMLCAHSVTVSGCRVDGSTPAEEACLSPNYYLRLFFTKRRHVDPVAAASRRSNYEFDGVTGSAGTRRVSTDFEPDDSRL